MSVKLPEIVGDAGIFVDGDWVESKDQDPDGDVRLVQLANIGDGEFLDKSARFLTSQKAAQLRCTYLQPGDILIARMPDPLGRACVFPEGQRPSITVVDVCIVRPDRRRVWPRWLLHKINSDSFRRNINDWVTGTTRQRISRGNLSKISFDLPPLEEQRRIAAILDKADALRRKRKRAIELLDTLTQSIFLEMFGDPIHSNSPKTTMLQVAICTQIGPFGSLLHREDYYPGGVPLINPMHIEGGSLKPSPEFAVSMEKFRELKTYHLKRGDIVMGRRGEMGRCAEVASSEKLLCGTGSLFIRPDQDKVLPTFLQALLSSRPSVAYLERSAAGVTMANLNKGVVDKLPFTLPSLASQEKFAAVREGVVRQRELATAMSDEAGVLFTSLQHRAFSGQL